MLSRAITVKYTARETQKISETLYKEGLEPPYPKHMVKLIDPNG